MAIKLLNCSKMLNPILHSKTDTDSKVYKLEPYVVAGDVYAGNPLEGRGGWSWYTGSASWLYRVGLESLLGFRLQGNKLKISPCIPNLWKEYEIYYKYGKSKYSIQVKNPEGLTTGKVEINVDGSILENSEINLIDDGKNHSVFVTLKARTPDSAPDHFYSDQVEL